MEQYIIKGGNPLVGEVEIGGAKNAALAILAAAIMTDEAVHIENLPDVRDINVLLEAIREIGATVDRISPTEVRIVGATIGNITVEYEYIKKIRASYYLLGALLGKYKNADRFRHLVGYRYFARTRKGIGATMKDCTADVVVTPLSKQQRFLLEKTSIPQMVFDCPSYFNMGIESTPETTPKLKALLDIITGEWKDAKSILVYSTYKEPQRFIQSELAKLGISSEVMNGDVSQREREAIIDKFKLGDIMVLITNVQKSLNFGNCNHCIFYSYNPNTNSMVQFEGRMTRSFDIVDKHVKLLVSRGKELKQFKSLIADRAKASDVFAGSDYSCVLSILLDDENLKNLK